MFNRIIVFVVAVLLGTYFLISTPAQNENDGVRPNSWRHLALASKDQDDAQLAQQINKLGSDGWELVDVENFVAAGETIKTVYYFKKPG